MKTVNKVLFVISNISFGGAQRVTWTLAQCMKSRGVEPVVVAVGHSTNNYTLPEGIKVIQLGQKHNYETLLTIKKLRTVIREEKPSVVITMGVATCLFSVPAMRGTKTCHIISERNDPRHFLGKKWVKTLSRAMMKKGDGFIFQTEEARDFYPESIRDKARVIANPILAAKLPEADRANAENTVVTMGRLTQQKNHSMLIDAFAMFSETNKDYSLHIYGSGEMRSQTEAYIADKGMTQKISLFEACDDVLDRVKAAGMFVLSSDFEGMPNALMEAMAMGLPCISTDCPCGGPRFLIKQDKNGVLVPVGDASALYNAMLRIAEDKEFADSLGNEAKSLKEELSAERICDKWMSFCEEIVNG